MDGNAAAIDVESTRAMDVEAGLQEAVDGNAAAIDAGSTRAMDAKAGLQETRTA